MKWAKNRDNFHKLGLLEIVQHNQANYRIKTFGMS